MENANLPTGNAHEPTEEAKQIDHLDKTLSFDKRNKNKHNLKFDEKLENTASQKSGSYKEVLSQPAPSLSRRQKLTWLQKRRTVGIWVQCDDCERWRYLPNVLDNSELPHSWYCRMNTDKSLAECSAPETPIHIREEEDLIHSEYSAGSIVWARLTGWPWWPAMVDDCPDVEQFYWLDGFSDIPTHYNVVFFDAHDVTRAWIAPQEMKPYNMNKSLSKNLLKSKKYRYRLEVAISQADDAVRLPLLDRLEKYSFLAKYKGNISSPKKVHQRDLLKYQKVFKRKFNVEFPIESSSDSEDDVLKNIVREKKISNARNESRKKPPIRKLNEDKVDKLMKIQSIHPSDPEHKINDSEKIDNESDSVAVLIGSDRNVPSLANTSNDNDITTNALETENVIEPSHNFTHRNVSPASDDFDFL